MVYQDKEEYCTGLLRIPVEVEGDKKDIVTLREPWEKDLAIAQELKIQDFKCYR